MVTTVRHEIILLEKDNKVTEQMHGENTAYMRFKSEKTIRCNSDSRSDGIFDFSARIRCWQNCNLNVDIDIDI